MKCILHGGFTREDNESNQAFFREFVNDLPPHATILLCYFASRVEAEIPEQALIHQRAIERARPDASFVFVVARTESFLEHVATANAVFFNGGSTSKLLRVLREFPNLPELLASKTVAGSSAGAYALAVLGASHSEPGPRNGLGIVPVRVVCHYESGRLPPLPESVAVLSSQRTDLPLVLLRDYEWKVFSR